MNTNMKHLRLELTFVPEAVRKKAEEELHETGENLVNCLTTLKSSLKEDERLISNMDDAFLIRFLRTKKFCCQNTLLLLKKYYGHRKKYPELYQNFSPRSVINAMNSNIMTFLPYRTDDGCVIWLSKFGEWDPSVSSFDENLKFGLMCLETASQYPVTQISGVVNILDLQDMSYRQFLQTTPSRLLCFISAVQDSFPLRQKETHVVYEPALFSFLFRLISPLLKEKIKERIHFHGYDMKTLHQYIPVEILPEKYGGTLKSLSCDQFYDSVMMFEDQLIKIQDYGYV